MSSPTKDSLLYLIYGQGPYTDEAEYSILSALHLMGRERNNYRIVVYTDDPEAFGDLPVHTELLSASVLDEWSGPLAFNHRRKIAAVKDALERFGGRVLLCDTDTCFVKHPKRAFARVRPGRAVMHVAEYYLSDRAARPMAESLAGHIFLDRAGSRWNIGGATVMFNSGLIGLHESDISILGDVISLIDQMYVQTRVPIVEQLALSVCLQHHSRLSQAYDVVHWPPAQRALFRDHLSRILQEQSLRVKRNSAHFCPSLLICPSSPFSGERRVSLGDCVE